MIPNRTQIFLQTAVLLLLLLGCRADPMPELLPTAALPPQIQVYVAGLQNPVGLAYSHGTLFVAEEGSGEDDHSAGITLVANGRSGRLISNLPSGRDSGDLSGVPVVQLSADGQTLYTSYFNRGALLTLAAPEGGWALPAAPLGEDDLTAVMQPLNDVRLINPFDIAFDDAGQPVVSDASQNGVAKPTADSTTRFIHRFDPLPNSGVGKPQIDAVPTGMARVGNEYFVTLTGGCPYPAGSGRLVAIDENRNQRTVAEGLNMPIDVVRDADGTIWLLEFAQFDGSGSCFSGTGYLPHTGRLSRVLADGTVQPVLTALNFPGSVVLADNGRLFISEIFDGRVLQVDHAAQIGAPLPVTAVVNETPLVNETAVVTETAVVPPQPSRLIFHDVADEVGIDFQHGAFLMQIVADPVAMMGGGVCWIDYDNDGWLDLYLVNSYAAAEASFWLRDGGLPANALFRNENGRFSNVSAVTQTDLVGRGNGCVAADLNRDGWTDLYVTTDSANKLLWNNGDGTFREGAVAAGVAAAEWNTAVAVGDLNNDGWLDMYVAAYIDLNNKIDKPVGAFPQDFYGLPDHLYLNNGDGTFTDVAAEAGLLYEERSLGAIMSDFDMDGDLDLYIANDGHPNRLYVNDAAPTELGFHLTDVTRAAEVGDSGSGMGVTSGDYNNDGLFDLFVTNWEAEVNALYQNEGGVANQPEFVYATYRIGISGLGNGMTGWGTTWADFDHDTDADLLVVNGRVPVTNIVTDPELVRFYGNRLQEGYPDSFREWTQQVGLGNDGLGTLLARGSAVADYDNDGDLDVAINNIGGDAVLLQNEGVTQNWLMVGLATVTPGVRVVLVLPDGRLLSRELHIGSSYLASEDPRLHFGLGTAERVTELRLYWHGELVYSQADILANQHLMLDWQP